MPLWDFSPALPQTGETVRVHGYSEPLPVIRSFDQIKLGTRQRFIRVVCPGGATMRLFPWDYMHSSDTPSSPKMKVNVGAIIRGFKNLG